MLVKEERHFFFTVDRGSNRGPSDQRFSLVTAPPLILSIIWHLSPFNSKADADAASKSSFETPKFEIRAKETVCRSEEFFFSQQGPTSIKFCHFYFVSVCKRSFLFVSHLALSHLARCSLVIDQVCGDNESRVRGKRGLHEEHCGLISRRSGKKIFYIIFVH